MDNLKAASRTVVCTIVAKNYLHCARTLMDSVRIVHPDWTQVVLLADERSYSPDPVPEAFELADLECLTLPDRHGFCYRYTLLELCTAVKPWLLEWLFRRGDVDYVVYLDPDVYVYRPLKEVEQELDRGALMVLTPHLTSELDDDRRPGERDILQAGAYNLGFLALSRHAELARFLAWWKRKLEFDCRVSLSEGLFVDQRWMDLAPGLFPDVTILRDAGYNVAYWNLKQRPVERSGGVWKVNGRPLAFFHLSGYDPLVPTALSRHQDRLRLQDLGVGQHLLAEYRRAVLANGLETCRNAPYAFGQLHDGSPVLDIMRRAYRRNRYTQSLAGENPFAHDHAYLNDPWDGRDGVLVTRLMRQLWEDRSDLREAFPDIARADRVAYAKWFVTDHACREGLPERLTAPVALSLRARPALGGVRSPLQFVHRAIKSVARAILAVLPPLIGRDQLRFAYARARPIARLLPVSLRRALKLELQQLLERPLNHGPVPSVLAAEAPVPVVCATKLEMLGKFRDLGVARSNAPPGLAGVPGLNIVGYVRSEHGVGESVRLCARAAEAAEIPFSLHEVTTGNPNRCSDMTWVHRTRGENVHGVNLLHINADVLPTSLAALGDKFSRGRYNVGYWHWEMPNFPAGFAPAFDLVDEIWVPSDFVRDSVQHSSPHPVIVVPHGIRFSARPTARRAQLSLPESHYLFLMMYDLRSVPERKNPEGAIEAFRRAFPAGGPVTLVVKVNNGGAQPEQVARLRKRLGGMSNVLVIDRTLSRQEVYDLESLCDCYVSLHRSEGFGLGLAEAMYLGKPAVATNWSGNLQFMTKDNSCLVDYNLVRLEQDYGPYARGQLWAEPDLDHAAWYLRKLVDKPEWAAEIAHRGQYTLWTKFSPEAIGRLYRDRLEAIHGRRLADATAA